jgi:hypothetical protein
MSEEGDYHLLRSGRTLYMRRSNEKLDMAIRDCEKKYGPEQADLMLVLIDGLRHVTPLEERLIIGIRLATELLEWSASKVKTDQAVRAALKRHVENHAMKADVFEWLDTNFVLGQKSMDDVAMSLAGKLVPAKFRAVRSWLTEWKKLRSACTA